MENYFEILNERIKELRCLYSVEELLKNKSETSESIFNKLLNIIPGGWQYSTICVVRIIADKKEYRNPDFEETEWMQSADLIIDNNIIGEIQVCYTQFIKCHYNDNQFLQEEQKLLNTIANRLSNFLFYQKLENTISLLDSPNQIIKGVENQNVILKTTSDEHWKWRYQMVEKIAKKIDLERFGINAMYLIGSTKDANAGPSSDIDIMMHFQGTNNQRIELIAWMQGWGLCLAELNYMKTGHLQSDGLIDLHIITDKDIAKKNSFASMIGSAYNSARLIKN